MGKAPARAQKKGPALQTTEENVEDLSLSMGQQVLVLQSLCAEVLKTRKRQVLGKCVGIGRHTASIPDPGFSDPEDDTPGITELHQLAL